MQKQVFQVLSEHAMRTFNLFLTLLLSINFLQAQKISVSPEFPTENDNITITFRADQASRKDLVGYTGTLYAHTGVITNESTSSNDWKHVIESWGNNSTQPALTRIDANTYQLVIGQPRSFYSVTDATENIQQIAFVFRSADATKQTENIYVQIYEAGLAVTISSPTKLPLYSTVGDNIDFTINTNKPANISLYIDNTLVKQVQSNILQHTYSVNSSGKKKVVITANDNIETFSDTSYILAMNAPTVQALPAGVQTGINYINESTVTLAIFAPNKDFVYLIGDFNDWQFDPADNDTWQLDNNYYMNITPDGTTYWKTLTGLTPGSEYGFQYLVDGSIRIADPYSEKVLDPWNDSGISSTTFPNLKPYPEDKTSEIVSVFQTNQSSYQWQTQNFEKPQKDNLVIYELLLRDFLAEHDFKTLRDTINYLKNLGINAIELMPINEFEGNNSWGYNPSFYFAVDKYYGPTNDLKALIDECHKNGIAVIMDMVLNHSYGQSPFVRLYASGNYGPPTEENPWYNVTSPNSSFSWGFDFNHESDYTKQLVDRILKYWVDEFRFDGFRLDFTKGFTQTTGDGWAYDASRINILKRIADKVWETDPNTYMILEHLTDNSEEKELAEYGIMLWGNMNYNYNEATMGYTSSSNSDFGNIHYKNRQWNKAHLVGYMESHDEERLMYKNRNFANSITGYDITGMSISLQRMKLAAAFFFPVPGPKMIWQFGELGYDYSINYPSLTSNDRLTPKPIRWDYMDTDRRYHLYQVWSELINLKKDYDIFSTESAELSVTSAIKTIKLNSDTMNVFIMGNFGLTENTSNYIFQHGGTWYSYFNSDSISISGNHSITLGPGDFHVFTDRRIFSANPEIILDTEQDIELPQTFKLSNNYPNPFNPNTTISYSIPNDASSSSVLVQLKIYDILGNEIATLINKEQPAGNYNITWDAHGISSGVYFYQLRSGKKRLTKKMILMK